MTEPTITMEPEVPEAPEITQAREARAQRVQDVQTVLRAAKDSAVAAAYADFASEIREGMQGLDVPNGGDDTGVALRAPTPPPPPAETPTGTRAVPVALRQPMDVLYRSYHRENPGIPELRDLRTPEIDHDMTRWLLGFIRGQRSEMIEVEMKYRHMRAALDLDLPTGAGHVPEPMANIINLLMQAGGKFRQAGVRIFRQGAGTTLKVPTSGIATAEMIAEKGTPTNAAGPTPGSVLLTKRKMRWNGSATIEFLEDSPFNTMTWLTQAAAEAFSALEDSQIASSSGTPPQFTGPILQGATDVGPITGAATYPDVVSIFYAVPERYRGRSWWMGDSATLEVLSTILDGNQRPIFSPYQGVPGVITDPAAGGTMGFVFGRPVIEVPITSNVLGFGPPSEYALLLGSQFQMASSDAVGWATDEIHFKVLSREDGVPMQPDTYRFASSFTSS